MAKWFLKHNKLSLAIILVAGIVVWVVPQFNQPSRCDKLTYGQTIEPLGELNLNRVLFLQPTPEVSLKPLMKLVLNRQLSDTFTVQFSPTDDILVVSGVGYAREMIKETFLWKLLHSEPCILEVGNYKQADGFSNLFEAFSPDGRFILLQEYIDGKNATLRDTQNNRLIDSFFDARFVQHENEIIVEYFDQGDTSPRISNYRWSINQVKSPPVEAVAGENVQLVDASTHKPLLVLEALEQIHDAAISHDGILLALALTKPIESTPYFHEAFVELWEITYNAQLER